VINKLYHESIKKNIRYSKYFWTVFLAGLIWSTVASKIFAQKSFTVDVTRPGAVVAPICRGQQIEEFNYQFEGGLYAQLIKNPSFDEIDSKLNSTPAADWSLVKSGSSNGNLSGQTSSETSMLNSRQVHCIKLEVLSVTSGSVGMANSGYWGIKLENNTRYKVSFWAKKSSNFIGSIIAKLESTSGEVYAKSSEFKPTADWQHLPAILFPRVYQKLPEPTGLFSMHLLQAMCILMSLQ